MTDTAIIIPITLAGRTQPVEFKFRADDRRGFSAPIFAARIGQGVKMNRTGMMVVAADEITTLTRLGYRTTSIVEIDGRFYAIKLSCTVRNATALIMGWADTFEGTGAGAKHQAYNAL